MIVGCGPRLPRYGSLHPHTHTYLVEDRGDQDDARGGAAATLRERCAGAAELGEEAEAEREVAQVIGRELGLHVQVRRQAPLGEGDARVEDQGVEARERKALEVPQAVGDGAQAGQVALEDVRAGVRVAALDLRLRVLELGLGAGGHDDCRRPWMRASGVLLVLASIDLDRYNRLTVYQL